jgi:hypothetical protein
MSAIGLADMQSCSLLGQSRHLSIKSGHPSRGARLTEPAATGALFESFISELRRRLAGFLKVDHLEV